MVKDSLFKDGRFVYFYEIDYFKVINNKESVEKIQIDGKMILKEASCQEVNITVGETDYTILLE